MALQIVIDTNVFVSAFRSKRGASYKLLSLIDSAKFEINISVPLILEYEDVAKRQSRQLGLTYTDIDDILNYLCLRSNHWKIFFLWCPYLKDPKDDMVLELAVEARCQYIITYNRKDFEGIEKFGIAVKSPKEILQEIGEIK